MLKVINMTNIQILVWATVLNISFFVLMYLDVFNLLPSKGC
jgi:hypothetical protein